jgi:hypothetical protein
MPKVFICSIVAFKRAPSTRSALLASSAARPDSDNPPKTIPITNSQDLNVVARYLMIAKFLLRLSLQKTRQAGHANARSITANI